MKRKIPHTTKLIATDEEENRRKFDFFSALVRKQRLDKIEKTLEIPTPSDGFRDWLTKVLWRLHCNSQPDARVRSSRTTLKRVLQDSAKRADELKLFAEQIWTSGELSVIDVLRDFTQWQDWQSSQPMHPSGVAWIGALDEFANRTRLLADTLAADAGGPRRSVAFDDLLVVLANYYETLMQQRKQPISEKQFFDFTAAMTDLVRNVVKRRPSAIIKLPPNDKALRERLRRVTVRSLADGT